MSPKSLLAQQANSSDSTRLYFIGTKFQSGFIWRDNRKLAAMNLHAPLMFQLDFSILKNEQRTWDYCGCYTKNGISLSYVDFGNANYLGGAVNLMLFTEPYLIYTKKIQLGLRMGAGLSYLNRIYNKETNPNNIAYSKSISYLLAINPNLYYSINTKTKLSAGLQFNHISNGGSRWPNWGLNMITGSLGVEYVINDQMLKKRKTMPFTNRAIKLVTHVFAGTHNSDPDGQFTQKKRMVGGINLGAVKPFGRINAIGLGGELYYDGINKVLETQKGVNYNLLIGSVSLQHYFFLGKLLFGQQLAYYITPINPDINSKLYQRYFLEYKIKGPWYGGVSLRSHGKISDYLTLSTGFIF